MGAVRRITEDDNIVAPCKVKEFRGIMGAVSIHEEVTSLASDFVFSLAIKIFNHPFKH